MSEKQAITRLRREASSTQNEKTPNIVARPTEKDMLVWHYVIHDLAVESPYCGGVYWGKLHFPKEYPLKPPAIYMLTPSGRFDVNTRLCLSMSDFHPESWNPSWRIESILVGLVSFMLDTSEPRTTGGCHASAARRREFAKESFDFNRKHSDFCSLFPEFCDEEKRHPSGLYFIDTPLDKVPAIALGSSESRGDGTDSENNGKIHQPPPLGRNNGLSKLMIGVAVVVSLLACASLLLTGGK